ncbi:MAG TPA: prephenate dehydrogenase [Chloroflexi bacterium]|nr:prephenate dehydrogenase [Chloroflexota bacterium]
MSNVTITIIGAGAIGTSLGLALKRLDDAPHLIVHDKDPKHSGLAMKRKAFDKSEWNLINACENADLIILAIPSSEINPTLEAIAPYVKNDVIISDTAQSKQQIVEMAAEILPDHAHFIGGNPIVAVTGRGPQAARVDLFQDTLYCLTPGASVAPGGVKLLEDMAALVGATPFFLDPVEHDGLMSGVVGLPTLLSIALVHSVSQPTAWKETRKLAGGLFSQVTSGAQGDANSLTEEFFAAKANTLRRLDEVMAALQTMKEMVQAEQEDDLNKLVEEALDTRDEWQRDFEKKRLNQLAPADKFEVEKPGFFKQLFGVRGPKIEKKK